RLRVLAVKSPWSGRGLPASANNGLMTLCYFWRCGSSQARRSGRRGGSRVTGACLNFQVLLLAIPLRPSVHRLFFDRKGRVAPLLRRADDAQSGVLGPVQLPRAYYGSE